MINIPSIVKPLSTPNKKLIPSNFHLPPSVSSFSSPPCPSSQYPHTHSSKTDAHLSFAHSLFVTFTSANPRSNKISKSHNSLSFSSYSSWQSSYGTNSPLLVNRNKYRPSSFFEYI